MKRLLLFIVTLILLSSVTISAQKIFSDKHDLQVLDLFIGQESLACKKEFNALIEVVNRGDLTEVFNVELVNNQLDLDEFSQVLTIEPEAIKSVPFNIKFEEEPKGRYEFEVLVYFNKDIKHFFKTFEFKGCPTKVINNKVMNNHVNNKPKIELQPTVSFSLILTLVLIFVIFLLAIAYVFTIYIKEK